MDPMTTFKIGFEASTAKIRGPERLNGCPKTALRPKEPPLVEAFDGMAVAMRTGLAIRKSTDSRGFHHVDDRCNPNGHSPKTPVAPSKSDAVWRFVVIEEIGGFAPGRSDIRICTVVGIDPLKHLIEGLQ